MSIEQQIAEAVRAVVREEIRAALRTIGPETLSTEQAAEFAQRSTKTVRAWVSSGELPAQKRGRSLRIKRTDLERVLAGVPAENDPIAASLTRNA